MTVLPAGVYGQFKPQPSLLMLRHPFAGHALGFSDLVRGHFASDPIPTFFCEHIVLCGGHEMGLH